MDKSERDQLINQEVALILQNAGPHLALRVRRAIDNNDLNELRRIRQESRRKAQESDEVLRKTRELAVRVDDLVRRAKKVEADTEKTLEEAKRYLKSNPS